MQNYTIEDYKKAIQEKYKREIVTDNFPNPSQANLRNLCWEIFEKNKTPDDLIIFKSFFGFEFDISKRNQFREHTDRFKPIGTFYRAQTDLTDKVAVNLAAILVDFQLRPFAKFKAKYSEDVKEIEVSSEQKLSIFRNEQNEKEKTVRDNEDGNLNEENKLDRYDEVIESVSLFMDLKKESSKKGITKVKRNILIIAVFIGMFFLVIYYFVQKKECMQWTGNHYEEVSCDLKVLAIGIYNVVEPLDERVINLRKIKVSDTTIFFKNDVPIIWYAKVGDSVEFFNTHGMHPEKKKPLKPVTQYIIDKYVK